MQHLTQDQRDFFKDQGYLTIENLIPAAEVEYYSEIYNSFLDNTIDSSGLRSDLSGDPEAGHEKITQIMVPGRLFPELLNKPIHEKTLRIAKELLGEDMQLDFDMLINKAPGTHTETPWHQDEAYWPDLPDKRAVSCWVAIDRALLENGCMWYTPGSHKGEVLPHTQIGNKGALQCRGSEEGSVYVELNPGSCVFHHGRTLHYSRGNTSKFHRRALITNFRPGLMIELERSMGYDHTGERKVK
ncbi:MAG: phytanoyl-CoA dioxygenase family protein [Cytophagales bacterium]|nr:phytanoyl-CoA dioxygenase family protein [Cytophagales bacterium]